MAKCKKCGKNGMGVLHSAVRLNDKNYVCRKCWGELGFSTNLLDMVNDGLKLTWNDVKDGREAYEQDSINKIVQSHRSAEAAEYGISTAQYTGLANAEATEMEIKIFKAIVDVLYDEGADPDTLSVTSGERGSLLVMVDGVVIIQYKGEPQVKWIMFPHESEEKIRIGGAARINSLADKVIGAYRSANI